MVTAINREDARGGVAYAVPIEAVQRAYRALAAGAHVHYAWLGVSAATVTPRARGRARLSVRARRARAQSLTPGGAAERAGLQAGTRRSRSPGRPIRATAT